MKKFKIIYTNHLFFQIIFYVTSLITYAPKTLPIFQYVVNNSAQGEEADFEINCVIMWQSQMRVCTLLPSNKYILYIRVD